MQLGLLIATKLTRLNKPCATVSKANSCYTVTLLLLLLMLWHTEQMPFSRLAASAVVRSSASTSTRSNTFSNQQRYEYDIVDR